MSEQASHSNTPAPRRHAPIRTLHAELLGLPDRHRVAIVTVVIAGEDLPEIIMFNGDPFLRDPTILGAAYRQVRPYRADVGA